MSKDKSNVQMTVQLAIYNLLRRLDDVAPPLGEMGESTSQSPGRSGSDHAGLCSRFAASRGPGIRLNPTGRVGPAGTGGSGRPKRQYTLFARSSASRVVR
jgi:hypothetical protein